ncbi:hypothetical protein ABH935_006265 [Catenulispora sp. GAS73]|uniref:condensation domain-containing protein n=1 Tax=Catenulispora sp. GAS73 TaxID=3156269 RepID=UPI0035192A88
MRADADPDAADVELGGTRQRYRDFLAGAWLPGLGPGAQPEPLPAQRIRVTFRGAEAGRAALTWGQRDIWATMRRQRNWLPQGGRRPLAPGTRVEDVAAELAYLHSRYQSMRTRLVFGDLADGAVRQWVAAAGETFLEVYDTPPSQEPDALAARVEAVYRQRPYDLRAEWPVRMAVVRSGGVCTHLVVLMHHLALDAGGAAVMMREVAGREQTAPTGMQPLEQAAWQASEAGRRHDARTLRYFAKALDRLADGLPPVLKPGPRRPRHWAGCLVSPALAGAVATVGARRTVDDAAVLTAVTAIAFARVTGADRVLMRPRVGNRFRPALADVVCFVAQSGLLVLELGDTTFDEAVDRARGATLAALKNAYFDPDALEAMLGRFAAEYENTYNGAPAFAMFFNDRHAAEPALDHASTGSSTFAWLHRGPEPAETLSVTIDDAVGALAVSVHVDTHVIAPETAEELVWGIERAAVEAAADGDSPTGIRRTTPPAPRPDTAADPAAPPRRSRNRQAP